MNDDGTADWQTEEQKEWTRNFWKQEKAREAAMLRPIADAVKLWRHCVPVCRRARRCAVTENPCYVRYREDFYQVIRKHVVPELRKQQGKPLYDPEAEITGDPCDPVMPGPARSAVTRASTSSGRKQPKHVDGRDKPGHDKVC